jgi:hypothetical protein
MTRSILFPVLGCLAALFTITAVPPVARAEMSPSAYERMQKESPEALTIQGSISEGFNQQRAGA